MDTTTKDQLDLLMEIIKELWEISKRKFEIRPTEWNGFLITDEDLFVQLMNEQICGYSNEKQWEIVLTSNGPNVWLVGNIDPDGNIDAQYTRFEYNWHEDTGLWKPPQNSNEAKAIHWFASHFLCKHKNQ